MGKEEGEREGGGRETERGREGKGGEREREWERGRDGQRITKYVTLT